MEQVLLGKLNHKSQGWNHECVVVVVAAVAAAGGVVAAIVELRYDEKDVATSAPTAAGQDPPVP